MITTFLASISNKYCCRISSFPTGAPIDSPTFFPSGLLTSWPPTGPPSPKHHRDHQYVQRALLVLPNIPSHCRSPPWPHGKWFGVTVPSPYPFLGGRNGGKKTSKIEFIQTLMAWKKHTGNFHGLSFRPLPPQVVMLHFWPVQQHGTLFFLDTCYQLELGTKHWKS